MWLSYFITLSLYYFTCKMEIVSQGKEITKYMIKYPSYWLTHGNHSQISYCCYCCIKQLYYGQVMIRTCWLWKRIEWASAIAELSGPRVCSLIFFLFSFFFWFKALLRYNYYERTYLFILIFIWLCWVLVLAWEIF